MGYTAALKRAIDRLATRGNVRFLGQAIAYPGTGLTKSFRDVPLEKLIELPVCEEMQLGMSLGLSVGGLLPVSVFPRYNFLLLAANQLINHIDKWGTLTGIDPHIIIKVGVGSEKPLHPGPQHIGDFSEAFHLLCRSVRIVQLKNAQDIEPAYERAANERGCTILVEYGDFYD